MAWSLFQYPRMTVWPRVHSSPDWPRGTSFRLHVGGETRRVHTRLVGRHQLYPFLAAVAVALAEGVALDRALARLAGLEPVTGRMQVAELANGAFLLRDDTAQMLTGQDLAPAGDPQSFLAWDSRGGGPVEYRADGGYGQNGLEPALSGTYTVTLASGKPVTCRPALALLWELAARYTPERSEAMTWVPAGEVRRAVRLFATSAAWPRTAPQSASASQSSRSWQRWRPACGSRRATVSR